MSKRKDKDQLTPNDEVPQGNDSEKDPHRDDATMEDAWADSKSDDTAPANDSREPANHQPGVTDAESKVISKGKASLIISGSHAARTEANEPQPLVPEPRVIAAKVEQTEPEEDELVEEIERLENTTNPGKERIKVDTPKLEKLEKRPDNAVIQEQQWGRGIPQGWWVVIAGASAAVILLGGLAIESWFDGDEVQTVTPPPAYVPPDTDPHEGSPEKWFHQRAGKIADDAVAVLEAFVAAKDEAARSQYVRFPQRYIDQMALKKVVIKPRLNGIKEVVWNINHTGDTAFLTLDCQDSDFLPFRAYFTRDGEHLKLDWEATVAWCESDLRTIKADLIERSKRDELIKTETRLAEQAYTAAVYEEPVLVRCMVRRRDEFYAGPYNDKDHSAFMLISADAAHYMWAYTTRDSALDLELRRLLDHGRFVVDLKKDIRITVRVRQTQKDALPSQLELVELVHPEWVSP